MDKFDRVKEIMGIKKIEPDVIAKDLGMKKASNGLYHAPYRKDNNPSLSVFQNQATKDWIWKDHATNQKGSWIDLYLQCGYSYENAIYKLRVLAGGQGKTEELEGRQDSQRQEFKNDSKNFVVVINSYGLLEKDKITLKKLRGFTDFPKEIQHVVYEINNRQYHGYGMQDVNGNWHIRSFNTKDKYILKTNNEKATYSYINNSKEEVTVVEGIHDYIAIWQKKKDSCNYVILNSVVHAKEALKDITKHEKINLALDKDKAGIEASKIIQENLKDKAIEQISFQGKDPAFAYQKRSLGLTL